MNMWCIKWITIMCARFDLILELDYQDISDQLPTLLDRGTSSGRPAQHFVVIVSTIEGRPADAK